jgi:predicted nucleic acid-binding protein
LKYLVDTNILIDVLRERAAAVSFIRPLRQLSAISALTYTELLSGVRSEKEFETTKKFSLSCTILPFGDTEAELAGDFIHRFAQSHAVALPDAAIAATAQIHGLELITLNHKHFPMFKALHRPY